jgi:hypothetical protein
VAISADTIGTIGEIAAGGAVAAVTARLGYEGLRKLRPFAKQSDATASMTPGTPLTEHASAELSDAKLFGEALLGALVTGFAAAAYLGVLPSLEDSWSGLEWAFIGFAPALWAVMQLHREPLPGEPTTSEETHVKAWLGFVAALFPLLIAASKFY